MHCITYVLEKKDNRCCFEAYSKAVTFHTITSLLACQHLFKSSDDFLFLDVNAD